MTIRPRVNKTSPKDDWAAVALTVAGFFVALAYVFITPVWQAPDEPSHLSAIIYIRNSGTLPLPQHSKMDRPIFADAAKTLGWSITYSPLPRSSRVPSAEDFAVRGLIYTANHPPLYYISAQPFVSLGEALWRRRILGEVYGVRLFSALLAALSIGLSFLICRRLDLPVFDSVVVAVLIILQPQFMYIASSVNVDSLTVFLFSLLIFSMLVETRGPQGTRFRSSGVILGLGLLTKITFVLGLPLLWLVAWLGAKKGFFNASVQAFAASLLALLISGWWFAGNLKTYGQPWYLIGGTGLGGAKISEFFWFSRFYQWLFSSYWGYFGWMQAPLPTYLFTVLRVLSLVSLVGLFLGFTLALIKRRSFKNTYNIRLLFMVSISVLFLLGAMWFRVVALTAQGRYLFPAVIPTTLAFWLGIRFWVGDRYKALPAAALIGFFAFLSWNGLILIDRL